jgi:hypothetical protein
MLSKEAYTFAEASAATLSVVLLLFQYQLKRGNYRLN